MYQSRNNHEAIISDFYVLSATYNNLLLYLHGSRKKVVRMVSELDPNWTYELDLSALIIIR